MRTARVTNAASAGLDEEILAADCNHLPADVEANRVRGESAVREAAEDAAAKCLGHAATRHDIRWSERGVFGPGDDDEMGVRRECGALCEQLAELAVDAGERLAAGGGGDERRVREVAAENEREVGGEQRRCLPSALHGLRPYRLPTARSTRVSDGRRTPRASVRASRWGSPLDDARK